MNKPVGVIGSGSFGITIMKLLLHNVDVILNTRRDSVLEAINERHHYMGVDTQGRVKAVNDLEYLSKECAVILPAVPSGSFRSVMKSLAPHVGPEHIMIHCTKGLDVSNISEKTVIASEFKEVIRAGQRILGSSQFSVFGSYDLKGAELAGAFKNIIAIGSGILGGLNMGKNMQAALITRGLREMIQFGQAMGADSRSFLGTAGIGDLIATATSESSRNYSFGKKLAMEGGPIDQITTSIGEVVEGVNTLNIIHRLAEKEDLVLPITSMLYRVIYEGYDVEKALRLLMTYNYALDVDFI